MTTDLRDRLSQVRIEVPQETAARHIAATLAELRDPGPAHVHPPVRRRKTAVLVLVASIIVLSATSALAAETAIPGDTLYPVKRATEWVRSWFDSDLPADNRVEELDRMIDRGVERELILEHIDRIQDTVGDDASRVTTTDQLDRVRDRLVDPEPPPTTHPPSDRVSPDLPVDDRPPPRNEPEPEPPTTTSTTRPDEGRTDEPPPDETPPGDDRDTDRSDS